MASTSGHNTTHVLSIARAREGKSERQYEEAAATLPP